MEDANRRIGNIVTCVCLNLEALMKRMNKNHESIGSLGKATKVYQTRLECVRRWLFSFWMSTVHSFDRMSLLKLLA